MQGRLSRGFPGTGGGFTGRYPRGGAGMRGGFAPHVFPFGGLLFAVFAIALVAVVVFLFWRILEKAGFEGALGLLMLVPLVNIGLIAYLALTDWPVLKELRERRLAYAQTAVPDVAPPPAPPAGAPASDAAETVIVPTAPLGDPVSAPPAESAPTEPLKPTKKHPSTDD